MAALFPQAMGLHARTTGSSIYGETLAIAGILGCVALVLVVFCILDCRRKKANKAAADLENAVVELRVQQDRAESLQRELSRREAFIERNILRGPEAYSATSPRALPKESSDLFVVGNDGESNSGDSGDDGESSPRSPTAVPAVRVRPNEIKAIRLHPKRVHNKNVDLGTAAQGRSRRHLRQADSPSQIDRYWLPSTSESPLGRTPRLADGCHPTEVKTAAAEVLVDQASASSKDVAVMYVSAALSSSSGDQDGSDTPESSLSPRTRAIASNPLSCRSPGN